MNEDDIQYSTNVAANAAILRAYADLTFLDRMRPIMEGVAKILIESGADFSKCTEPGRDKCNAIG